MQSKSEMSLSVPMKLFLSLYLFWNAHPWFFLDALWAWKDSSVSIQSFLLVRILGPSAQTFTVASRANGRSSGGACWPTVKTLQNYSLGFKPTGTASLVCDYSFWIIRKNIYILCSNGKWLNQSAVAL